MILRRILLFLAATTALSVSAGVCVVALAFALYALVKPYVGQAGGAAVVAGASALLIGLIGLTLGAAARPPKRKPSEAQSFIDRVVEFIRDKPVTAIGAAIAAGLLAVRNPQYLGAALRAFIEGRNPPKR
ncbi:MAG: hypothetical protein ACHP7N_06095 [Caulobacterales bacterium]